MSPYSQLCTHIYSTGTKVYAVYVCNYSYYNYERSACLPLFFDRINSSIIYLRLSLRRRANSPYSAGGASNNMVNQVVIGLILVAAMASGVTSFTTSRVSNYPSSTNSPSSTAIYAATATRRDFFARTGPAIATALATVAASTTTKQALAAGDPPPPEEGGPAGSSLPHDFG